MHKFSERHGQTLLQKARARLGSAFNVGVLIPTAGAMGLLGPCAYACARLARDLWNEQGGVDGREVRLSLLNSSESAISLAGEVRELVQAGDVDALVVLSNTAVCRELAAAACARVPLIYTPLYEGSGLPAWVHAIGETPQRQLFPAIDWIQSSHNPRRWYLLGNDYSWPRRTHALAIPMLRSAGAEVVRERYVPLGQRDFSAVIEEIISTRAQAVLLSLLAADAVHMCRAFEQAGLPSSVLRLSMCVEENAVLGVGQHSTEAMYIAAGYFAALDTEPNGSFKERYFGRFGERAPVLNSASQSVYEGFVHLHRQVHGRRSTGLPSARASVGSPYEAERNPIYLAEVQGLTVRPIRSLTGELG
jgi:ABC-type branched-subunit amino acid transport system substrate-binding protein